MSATTSLPRLFGPYLLTRHFGDDRLGGLYRAGTLAGRRLQPFLLIRIFSGASVDRTALLPAMETAVEYLEEVRGPAVAKGAVLGIVDDVPFAGIEYVPGRTLDRLLTGDGGDPVSLPIEHALLIGEKILIALEAGKPFEKKTGASHGFLVPSSITVSNDGDIRVFGNGLGAGLLPSMANASFRSSYGPYFAPEVAESGQPSTSGDIYSMAAILLEGLTGRPPEPGAGVDALSGAIHALSGEPLPDDVKRLLARGLAKSPAQRENDVVSYRKQLGKLLYGGPYAPSTFNLAFFMHQRFEKPIEKERRELAAEEEIDPTPLVAAEEARSAAPRPAPRAPQGPAVPSFGLDRGTSVTKTTGGTTVAKKSSAPVVAVVGGLAVVAVGAYLAFGRGKSAPAPPPVAATPVAAPAAPPTPAPTPAPVFVGKEDPAFQAALEARLKEEAKKVQDQIGREQDAAARKRQAELEKVAEAARQTREAEEAARLARDRADKEEAARLAREVTEARAREDAARKAAEAAVPKVKEGDLVDVSQVDTQASATKIIKPDPTALARQRKVSGTVLLRVLVDETGKPAKVEILRDTTPKVGLGEASRDAVERWEFTPATKDGKRVKSWTVIPIPFRFQ